MASFVTRLRESAATAQQVTRWEPADCDMIARMTASWQRMERVGMRRQQHTVRDALHRSGEWDGYGALLADEWRSRAGDDQDTSDR